VGVLLAAPSIWLQAQWWLAWSDDPFIWGGLLALAWFYVRGVGQVWGRAGRGRGVAAWQVVAFGGGLLVLVLALLSPLEMLSGALFSAHMTQHLLLMLVAPPLLLLGAPPMVWAWALPYGWRRPLAGWWRRRRRVRQQLGFLTHPLTAWLAYGLALWVWHIPALYEAAVLSAWVHGLEHACFLGTAVLFWYALGQPGRRGRLNYATGLLFIFTTAMHNTLLGALITFATVPWYGVYAGRTLRWGLEPLADQQLAGAIMWAPAGLIYLLAALLLLYSWFQLMERRDRRQALASGWQMVALLFLTTWMSGCALLPDPPGREVVPGGDVARGRTLVGEYGCTACHVTPGVNAPEAYVGPPLDKWARRAFIAGNLANTPDNLTLWLQNPELIEPGTAMPNLFVTEQDARDMTAYLFSLR
jgi:putative membrane protein